MNKQLVILPLLLLILFCQPVLSNEYLDPTPVQIDTIATGLGVPWGMALLPNNTMLITQREGQLSQLNLATGNLITISGLAAIKVGGQGGLFDVALPPNYHDSKWIYFSYNKDVNGQGATTLARAKLDNKTLVDWQDLLVSKSTSTRKKHYGGRITFDHQGHVFMSIGERGVRSNAQDLTNHAGSIVRLNLDGSVPSDNPFVDNPDALPEIWSIGHRNPQGLFYNPTTQQLWAIEHGPRGGDEINLIEPGNNYGWPEISYGQEYFAPIAVGKGTEQAGMEQPVKVYIPSIAPGGLIQYQGDAFAGWQGNLLATALNLKHLNRIMLDDNNQVIAETRLLQSQYGRLRTIIESPEGWLYISTDDGKILVLCPSNLKICNSSAVRGELVEP